MPFHDDLELHFVDSIDEAMAMKRWLGERRDVLGLDLETSGLRSDAPGAKIRLIQIGDERHGWAIPWEMWGGAAMECLNSWEGRITGHNIVAFDALWLQDHAGWTPPYHRIDDTLIGARICEPANKFFGLKSQLDRYVDPRASLGEALLKKAFDENGWDKGEGFAKIPVDFPAYWQYGALDAVGAVHLQKHYNTAERYPQVYDLELAARRVASQMERNGFRIDTVYCQRKYEELSAYVAKAKQWAKTNLGIDNIMSGPQLKKFFVDKLELPYLKPTASGAPSMDGDQLKWYSTCGVPEAEQAAKLIIKAKKAEKLANTYFKNLLEINVDSVIRAEINTLAARTGRMSIRRPALQTLPKGEALVRDAFVARYENDVLISSDYSQIEMREMAHFCNELGDPGLAQAFIEADSSGGDFFVNMGRQIYKDPDFSREDPRRGLVKNCVPLSSQILTKRGWLSHDEVAVGDETLGYDFETGTNKWTKVTAVHHSPNAEVYEMSHNFMSFKCTSDHRWIVDNGRSGVRGSARSFKRAYEIPNTENRIILSAPAAGGSSSITPHEAEVLGWVLSDGSIKRGVFVGGRSQGANGEKVKCQVDIFQTKPYRVAELDTLLSSVPHKRYRKEEGKQQIWMLNSDWSRDVLSRAGITDKYNFDPWALATSLSVEARKSMLYSLDAGDGKGSYNGKINIIQQQGVPVAELCVALMYLEGYYPSKLEVHPRHSVWQKNICQLTCANKPSITGQKMKYELAGVEDTWCVTTELGSWTMRQENKIPMITGNSLYGRAYGATPMRMALSAGIDPEVMQEVDDAISKSYPGLDMYMQDAIDQGRKTRTATGEGYILTPYGRKLPCDGDSYYTLANYKLQAHAAEILKEAMVKLDKQGISEYLLLPIHDELIASCPREECEEIKQIIKETMSVKTGYAVPFPAEPEGPFDRWGEKYRKGKNFDFDPEALGMADS